MNAITLLSLQKRFYDRETIAAINHEIHKKKSYLVSFYATKISTTFLNSRI